MSQEQILNILKSEIRFWSAIEIAKILGQREQLVRQGLARISKNNYVIVRVEEVKYGLRKSYKYLEEENGKHGSSERSRRVHKRTHKKEQSKTQKGASWKTV